MSMKAGLNIHHEEPADKAGPHTIVLVGQKGTSFMTVNLAEEDVDCVGLRWNDFTPFLKGLAKPIPVPGISQDLPHVVWSPVGCDLICVDVSAKTTLCVMNKWADLPGFIKQNRKKFQEILDRVDHEQNSRSFALLSPVGMVVCCVMDNGGSGPSMRVLELSFGKLAELAKAHGTLEPKPGVVKNSCVICKFVQGKYVAVYSYEPEGIYTMWYPWKTIVEMALSEGSTVDPKNAISELQTFISMMMQRSHLQ